MSVQLDIEQVKAILTGSALVTSWHILLADEMGDRAFYKFRCQLLSHTSSRMPREWAAFRPHALPLSSENCIALVHRCDVSWDQP